MADQLMRFKRKGLLHRSREWLRARLKYWYPATEQILRLTGKSKYRIPYYNNMRDWLRQLQKYAIDPVKAMEIFIIGQGYFNRDGNEEYIPAKFAPKNAQIPIYGKLLTPAIAQSINSDGNVMLMRRKEGKYAICQAIDPAKPLPTHLTPEVAPHLFCRFTAVQIGTGKPGYAVGGAVFPIYAEPGFDEVRVLLSDLELA